MLMINDFIPRGRHNRPGIFMNPLYITVHDTGNRNVGADARMHAKYVKTTDDLVSWHYTVDEHSIYQHLPLSEVGWHAGDGNGNGNMKSIGIEICMNEDGNRQLAEERAVELIVYLMKKYNIPSDNVVQHNYWSGKNCPQLIRARKDGWTNFKKEIARSLYDKVFPNDIQGHWAQDEIMYCIERNIFTGFTDGTFKPDKLMTRGEVAAVLARAIIKLEE